MYDANALLIAAPAISALLAASLISPRTAAKMRKTLKANLNEAIGYWGEKGADDIVDRLNAAYVSF